MWRKAGYAASGLILACAVVYGLSSVDLRSSAINLALSGLYPAATKRDRLPITVAQQPDHVVMAFNVPSVGTTIVAKGPTLGRVERGFDRVEFSSIQAPRIRVRTIPISPVQTVPNAERNKKKLLVGCEPAFSPVTMPALAHISARCDA